jgi:glucokinase
MARNIREERRVVADIGGTNVRFATQFGDNPPQEAIVLRTKDYPDPGAAFLTYLERIGVAESPTSAAFAIACPVTGDRVEMTNHPWSFSITELRQRLGLDVLRVINDFTAVALAVPHLRAADLEPIGGGVAVADAPIAVIGPGTGLGVSVLMRGHGAQVIALETEGGHATCPPLNDHESAVLATMRRRFGHVSAERCISGPGLVNLYRALAELDGRTPELFSPADVTENAADGSLLCLAATDMFCALLGTVTANLALSVGARGGVYIGGGIVPRLGALFNPSRFRQRFEDKGRFSDYLKRVPINLILHPTPALIGLAALLDEDARYIQE